MNTPEKWSKVAACAGATVEERDTTAPYGFATRVAAVWAAGSRPLIPNMWEWLSIRSVAVALGVMALTLAWNADLFAGDYALDVGVADFITGPIL